MAEAAKLLGIAASILDEETATGALAAHQLAGQSAVPGEHALRQPRHDALWRDLHDLVDMVAAAMPRLQAGLPMTDSSGGTQVDSVPELRTSRVQPGQQAQVTFKVRNEESTPKIVTLMCSDLLGSEGTRISAEHVRFSSSGSLIDVGQQIDVSVSIAVPGSVPKGRYTGLVMASGLDYLRALLVLEVG